MGLVTYKRNKLSIQVLWRPILDTVVLFGAALGQLKSIFQNGAGMIITDSSFDAASRPLIKGLGWKTIDELVAYETKITVFKSLNEPAPQYLRELFLRNSQCPTYSLRNTGTDLRLPRKMSNNGQRFFFYRGEKLWNSLSA